MSWEKQETPEAIGIGDGKDQKPKAGGLLAEVREVEGDNGPFMVYDFVQRDGTTQAVYGSSAIDRELKSGVHVGRFIKLVFKERVAGKKGREFKDIDVEIWKGDPTDDMRAWPRFEELQPKPVAAPSIDEFPGALDASDDDLPF